VKKELVEIDFKKFPTTRYQGSKRKILPWIHEVVKDLEFETVLDACGGSASVSFLFKKMNKTVTYNDKLKFNYFIGKAIIENSNVTFTDEDFANLLGTNDYVTYYNFIEETFEDIYYHPSENRILDRLVSNIIHMNHYEGTILDYKKAIAYYALFQASLIKRPFNLFHRNNLYIRTNKVDRNFGNKITWDKAFKTHLKKFMSEVNSNIFDSGKRCIATNESLLEMENTNFDLVYIDSPYLNKEGNNETSNYLKCYHFLEGLSNYNQWEGLIDFDSNNLRFNNADKENDFNKETIHQTFENIFEKFRNSILVISYKKGGTPSINFLVKLMKKFKKNVVTKSQHYTYALSKQNGDAKMNREVLIIGI
jgi:adenine-specific DNA-methyltransferase